jgi:lipopolysaccharide/colanic/teichoic acid biosynthesis glycosyltransferase
MNGTEQVEVEFTYPKKYFLQRISEEIYRSNRRNQSFLWIEIPLKDFMYKRLEIWKIAVQTILSKEYMGIIGQGKNSLWCLYPNKDLQFLEDVKDHIKENVKKAGLLEEIPNDSYFKAYFYSGKSQSFINGENRFIKKWNNESPSLKIKRISIEDVKQKTFSGVYERRIKRLIDIVGSLFGIVIFSLVMLMCAILVKRALFKWEAEQRKLGKEAPKGTTILFRQIRVGRDGRLFRCYKFRTMYPGADKEKEKLKQQQEVESCDIKRGPTFKMENDPRILKYGGTFLRKHSLDELPQFFNVLMGDMSLVGPRPPTPDEVKKYEAWHYIRLSVKPGLTCIWQTSGRNEVDFDEWMRLDNKYIRERSTLKDFNLKLKTLEVMFNGKGAS